MRRGFFIVLFSITILSALVFAIPKFIDFNRYKDKLTKKIESVFEIPIKIDGNINISILPYVRISAKDIKILTNDKSSTIINIKNIYIELELKELLNIDNAKLKKIILNGLTIDLTDTSGKVSQKEVLSNLISDNLFNKIKSVKIQNSILKYFDGIEGKNDTINNINLNITKKTDDQKTFEANGTITLKQLDCNLKSTFIISDLDNYDTISEINYKNSKTENIQINLKSSKRQDLFNIIGDITIKSNEIEKLIKTLIPSFPNLKITDKQSKLSSNIQYTNNILQINELQFTNGNTFATGSFNYNLITQEKNLNIHYKNFEIPKHLVSLNDKTELLKQIILQINNFKLNITTDQFKLNDTKINNLDLKTEITKDKKLIINEFKISSDKINGTINGDILIKDNKLIFNTNISANTNLKYSLTNLNPIIINSFDGNINGSETNFYININSINTNIGLLSGEINKKINHRNKYKIKLDSKSLNIDNILTKNIFEFMKFKNKIELFKNSDFSFEIKSNNLVMQKEQMKSFNIICNVLDDSISISKLNWKTDGYTISINGKLNNITKSNGMMDNINYEIKSFDFSNVKIGYLSKIPFLSNLLQQESGTIKFILNGYAGNPNITIKGKTSNIDLSASITNQNKIDLTIDYSNSKEFINKLYGETYNTTQKILKNNSISIKTKIINENNIILFKDISISSNNQKASGTITISEIGKISVNMNSNKIDLTKLIKNSNDDYKQNLMIYTLNNTGSDINLNIDTFKTYTRTYSNLKLKINKATQNPEFSISANFNKDANILINGMINGNQYTGNIQINNAPISEPFFNINDYDITNGKLTSSIDYETFGSNKSEIISNLSGNITADFINGKLIGLSGKNDIEDAIYSAPVIITNDVIQIIEEKLISGESNFNTIKINANIINGTIENGQITIDINDLIINGLLNATLTEKQFSISGNAVISDILPTPANATYKISGNTTDVKKEAVLESIISKVNPTFFKMKKHEYTNKIQDQNID